jgi:hypothetical protein
MKLKKDEKEVLTFVIAFLLIAIVFKYFSNKPNRETLIGNIKSEYIVK